MMNNQLQEFHEVAKQLRAQSGRRHGREGGAEPDRREEGAREGAGAAASSSSLRGRAHDLASQAVDVKGAKVLAATLDGADAKTLRETHGQAEGPPEVARRSCSAR